MRKLLMALAAYVVLAVLAWQTLADQKVRLATFAILAFFALRTWLHWRRQAGQLSGRDPAGDIPSESEGPVEGERE